MLRELAAARRVGRRDAPDGGRALAAELGREGQRRAVRRRAQRRRRRGGSCSALVALLAREAPARTLAAAAGLDPRTVLDALSELARAGLLRLGEQGWAPAHDLVGETVAPAWTPASAAGCTGCWPRALEAEGADPSEVARHHRDAGDAAAAAATYARAAHRALRRSTPPGRPPRWPTPGSRWTRDRRCAPTLLDARAEARAAHGELAGALADLHAALADAAARTASRRLARLAMLTFGAQDPRRAAELAELALVEAGDDDAARAIALETAAILDMNLDHAERARSRAEEALRAVPAPRRRAAGSRGSSTAGRWPPSSTGGSPRAWRCSAGSRSCSRTPATCCGWSPRGRPGGTGWCSPPGRPRGWPRPTAALRLARELDAPEGQAYALWHRSEALSGLGRVDEAEADAREALRIARAAGHRGWTATALPGARDRAADRGELGRGRRGVRRLGRGGR